MQDPATICPEGPLSVRPTWKQCRTCIPHINYLCTPLLTSCGLMARVTYFRKALEAVIVTRDASDLLTLAGYRRMVGEYGVQPLDRMLYNLANELGVDWHDFARRMPRGTSVAFAAHLRAEGRGIPRRMRNAGWQGAR